MPMPMTLKSRVTDDMAMRAQMVFDAEKRNWTIERRNTFADQDHVAVKWVASRAERYDFAEKDFLTEANAHGFVTVACWRKALDTVLPRE